MSKFLVCRFGWQRLWCSRVISMTLTNCPILDNVKMKENGERLQSFPHHKFNLHSIEERLADFSVVSVFDSSVNVFDPPERRCCPMVKQVVGKSLKAGELSELRPNSRLLFQLYRSFQFLVIFSSILDFLLLLSFHLAILTQSP